MTEPLPLRASEREDRPYRLEPSELDDGHWRFAEIAHGDGDDFSFDFRAAPADEALLARKCRFLQTDPASPALRSGRPDPGMEPLSAPRSTVRPDRDLRQTIPRRIGISNHPSRPSLPTPPDARNRPDVERKLRGGVVCLANRAVSRHLPGAPERWQAAKPSCPPLPTAHTALRWIRDKRIPAGSLIGRPNRDSSCSSQDAVGDRVADCSTDGKSAFPRKFVQRDRSDSPASQAGFIFTGCSLLHEGSAEPSDHQSTLSTASASQSAIPANAFR